MYFQHAKQAAAENDLKQNKIFKIITELFGTKAVSIGSKTRSEKSIKVQMIHIGTSHL